MSMELQEVWVKFIEALPGHDTQGQRLCVLNCIDVLSGSDSQREDVAVSTL